jgi:CRISPR-associated protein Cas5d
MSRQRPVRLWLRASGTLACFSRPEFSVERTSYPWITPSAARGIFEAVLWKPRIRYEVREIRVLAPIRYINLRRNEVANRLSTRGLDPTSHVQTDSMRQQRNTVALQNVAYVIGADLTLNSRVQASGPDDNHGKYAAMFQRRLRRGQRFHAPYLGCREFAADVDVANGEEPTCPISMDHGTMFYDYLYYDHLPKKKRPNPQPLFFQADMQDGVVSVPTRYEVLQALPEARQ